VQEAYSGKSFYNRHIGVVMTNQYFTAAAKEAAKKTGVLLWDRDKLEEMIAKVTGVGKEEEK
jgi:restriction system protein